MLKKRTPVIMLIDTSYSMEGLAIDQVNQGIKNYIEDMQNDEKLVKIIDLTVITFNSEIEIIFEHQAIDSIHNIPTLTVEGCTALDKGLQAVTDLVKRKMTTQGNRGPLFVFMSDGNPTCSKSEWESELTCLNDNPITGYGARVILGAGNDINDDILKAFVRNKELDKVMRVADLENLTDFFKYLRTITQEFGAGKVLSQPIDVLPQNQNDSIELVERDEAGR